MTGTGSWGCCWDRRVNQDGASAGLTVPNGPAQERVIREALSRAGVEASSVDYLEAHGTGTELGDPVEVAAAAAVYGEGREAERPLLLGSVKTNIGHLESAAGVAGLVKVLLALGEGVIPPHLHLERPNPRIAWEELPVRVVTEAERWPEGEGPRRAAVSSFGFSGTNAHVVIEAYEEEGGGLEGREFSRWAPSDRVGSPGEGRPPEAGEAPYSPRTGRVLPLSGKTPDALRDLAAGYLDFLTEDVPLADAAWTAGVGRSHFAHRAGLVFGDLETLRGQLESLATGGDRDAAAGGKVAFLYPGEASAWPGMGRELYGVEPVFREVLDRCEAAFVEERESSLLAVLLGEGGETGETLGQPEWRQPALYAVQSGLTALWASVGVVPEAVFGQGSGEVAAASAAGVFAVEDGLRLASLLESGALGAEPGEVGEALGEVSAPSVAFVSGLSGRVLEGVPDRGYWRNQAREAVRLETAMGTLAELGVGVLVELAPEGALGPLVAHAWPGEARAGGGFRGGGGESAGVRGGGGGGLRSGGGGLVRGAVRRGGAPAAVPADVSVPEEAALGCGAEAPADSGGTPAPGRSARRPGRRGLVRDRVVRNGCGVAGRSSRVRGVGGAGGALRGAARGGRLGVGAGSRTWLWSGCCCAVRWCFAGRRVGRYRWCWVRRAVSRC